LVPCDVLLPYTNEQLLLWTMDNVQLEFMYGLFMYKNGFAPNYHLIYLVRNNNPQTLPFSIIELFIFLTGIYNVQLMTDISLVKFIE